MSILFGALTGNVAIGCSCIAPGPPLEEAAEADAVFVAIVESLAEVRPNNSWLARTYRKWVQGAPYDGYLMDERRVEFRLSESFKGTLATDQVLFTNLSSPACGYVHFRPQEAFLIYAFRDKKGVLYTGMCTRTTPAESVDEEIALLRRQYGNGGDPSN